MDGFLSVDNATTLPNSPSNSFIADEVASICPLITPSPPTNALINPLAEQSDSNFTIGDELTTKLQQVEDSDKADSASSSSSALAEPACAQLLNHRSNYYHIVKDEETEIQENNGKSQPLQLTFRNPPDNYFFMTWNWPLIRKISMWMFLAGLAAMVAVVIAMISSLPKTCNPPTQWYQGNLFYEIFPASFYSGQQLMEGDFKGISMKADYIKKLGIRGVRLNSIFTTPNYPKDFENVTSLVDVAPALGDIKDFDSMVKHLKSRNISLILDLPVYPYVKKLSNRRKGDPKNDTSSGPTIEFLRIARDDELDAIEDAILQWSTHGVEGFYLKGLEYLVDDPNLAHSLRRWKRILGENRIIIVSEKFINVCPSSIMNIVLNNVDLIDVKLCLENGAPAVAKQLFKIQNGTLFSKPGMPWVHWSLGNAYSNRLANVLPYANATLGATLLQMMLPGTPSVFYGDEVGLQEIVDTNGERQDIKHLHQLSMMPWANEKLKILPWIYGGQSTGRFNQIDMIAKMTALRMESPSIYMNSVYKEGVNKANAEIKYAQQEFLVIQRWYPRRKAYVVASNLGREHLSTDLSTLLYSGEVVVGPKAESRPGSISFKDISLWPGESVVIVLH